MISSLVYFESVYLILKKIMKFEYYNSLQNIDFSLISYLFQKYWVLRYKYDVFPRVVFFAIITILPYVIY